MTALRIAGVLATLSIPWSPGAPVPDLAAQIATATILNGEELMYRGHFGAARVYFADLAKQYERDPAGPALEASALIWAADAVGADAVPGDSVDVLLADAVARAQAAYDGAGTDSARSAAQFWLSIAYGHRARLSDLRGSTWRAAREARAMRDALQRAVALDSTCVDCLLGLGVYDYELARAGGVARFIARIIGLGSGDAARGLERMRRVMDGGVLLRVEAGWVYGNALLREGARDPAQREAGLLVIGDLAARYPDNPIFSRPLTTPGTGQ